VRHERLSGAFAVGRAGLDAKVESLIQKRVNDFYTNQLELCIIGMSRSGNHAIIHWLLAQAQGRTCFLNCAEGKTNPFASARPLHSGLAYEVNYSQFDYEGEQNGNFSSKDLLIHSYEDSFLGHVCHPLFEANHNQWVGSSHQRYDVLILRDPFNLFASRRHSRLPHVSTNTGMRIWKQHAREFLRQTHRLNRPYILINYNRWATEQAYRRQLAAQLGLRFTDAGFLTVQKTGGGSSFDGLRYDGQAERMKTLERWKVYQDDPSFRKIFDLEAVGLASQIFGALSGIVEALVGAQGGLGLPRYGLAGGS
jgi:hypothetical protein